MQTQKYLEAVGDKNKFQIYSIVFVCIKWLIVSFTVFLPSYLFVTPTFTCGSQTKVFENDACTRLQKCSIQFPDTITAHMHLYCEKKFVRDSILSVQFVGSVTGLVIASVLADKYGRKKVIVGTLALTLAGAIFLTLGAKASSLFFLYIGQILMGFGGYSLSMVSYSYLSQINNDLWRQKSLVLTYAFWAFGQIGLYPVIVWMRSWQLICTFVFIIPLIGLLVMSFFISQTPQFLYANKNYDQCLNSLNYIAKFNGLPPIQKIQPLQQHRQQITQQITDTFTKRKYLIPLIVFSFAQVCNNGLYYATQYSISQLGSSFEVNMLVIGILELISVMIANHYCHLLQRRKWIMICMIISGSIGLLVQFLNQQSFLEISLIGISRLANTFAFTFFSLIISQTFPTSIKSTGMGISQAMSNVGNMVAPFLVTIGDQIGVKGVFISGIVCVIGGISMSIVQETKKFTEEQTNEGTPGTYIQLKQKILSKQNSHNF